MADQTKIEVSNKKLPLADFLSEAEMAKIAVFNQDTVLVNAIKKVLLASIYSNGTLRKDVDPNPTRNGALGLASMAVSAKGLITNEQLGEDLRSLAQGVSLLETGLNELAKIKSKAEDKPDSNVNPGI